MYSDIYWPDGCGQKELKIWKSIIKYNCIKCTISPNSEYLQRQVQRVPIFTNQMGEVNKG